MGKVHDIYAQCYHPSGFIADEMAARGWSLDMLLDVMMMHYPESREKLEWIVCIYFEIGPTTKQMRMGDTLRKLLHKVFGISQEFWTNVEQSWLEDPSQPHNK